MISSKRLQIGTKMATKGISVQASRFALLKVEDEGSSEEETKPKQTNKKQAQHPTSQKKKSRKKKKNEGDTTELRNLAFGGKSGPKQRTLSSNGGPHMGAEGDNAVVPKEQYEQWKKLDEEYTAESYEKDLEQALLMSKLDYEEHKEVLDALKDDDLNKSGTKDGKKKKKKDKPAPMSLDEFNQLGEQRSSHNSISEDPLEPISLGKSKSPPVIAETDPKFFDKVNQDVSKILQKEKIQEEYRKQYLVENARTQQYQDEIEKRDKEIETLREGNKTLEEELKQVKKRNLQLCKILSQGEMKDKRGLLLDLEQLKEELEDMKQVREELTQEVHRLTVELEKEKSQKKDRTAGAGGGASNKTADSEKSDKDRHLDKSKGKHAK